MTYLAHHGVKGMKWGKHKKYYPRGPTETVSLIRSNTLIASEANTKRRRRQHMPSMQMATPPASLTRRSRDPILEELGMILSSYLVSEQQHLLQESP